MTRSILFILSFITASAAIAAPCTTPPKVGLTVDEIQIAITDDGRSITMAWPTTTPNLGCCSRTDFDYVSWRDIFRQRMTDGNNSVRLTEFLATVTVPGGPLSTAEQARCQAMIDRVLPGPTVVRNPYRTDGARPMKLLKDPAQPYSAANPLVDLKIAGVLQYVDAGRSCERSPVVNTTSAGQWLYVTNASGQRGVALCK